MPETSNINKLKDNASEEVSLLVEDMNEFPVPENFSNVGYIQLDDGTIGEFQIVLQRDPDKWLNDDKAAEEKQRRNTEKTKSQRNMNTELIDSCICPYCYHFMEDHRQHTIPDGEERLRKCPACEQQFFIIRKIVYEKDAFHVNPLDSNSDIDAKCPECDSLLEYEDTAKMKYSTYRIEDYRFLCNNRIARIRDTVTEYDDLDTEIKISDNKSVVDVIISNLKIDTVNILDEKRTKISKSLNQPTYIVTNRDKLENTCELPLS